MSQTIQPAYGQGSNTFDAVGGTEGVNHLVDTFYTLMESTPRYQSIHAMHQRSGEQARDRLARFLSSWMGGPHSYREKYGPINIPGAHAHLAVGPAERNLWLDCMSEAIDRIELNPSLAEYLIRQLSVPADRIVAVCQRQQKST